MNVEIKVDTKSFESNAKQLEKDIRKQRKEVMLKATANFVNTASLYTPPNMSSKSINEKHYQRTILYLPKEVKRSGNKEKSSDLAKLRDGFLFKIYKRIPLTRRFQAFYFKKMTKSMIKKETKIKNRGLLRAAWGLNLMQIGQKIPANIKRMLTKSKNLLKLTGLNKFVVVDNEISTNVMIVNDAGDANQSSGYVKIAEREGRKTAENYIKRSFKKLEKENIKL